MTDWLELLERAERNLELALPADRQGWDHFMMIDQNYGNKSVGVEFRFRSFDRRAFTALRAALRTNADRDWRIYVVFTPPEGQECAPSLSIYPQTRFDELALDEYGERHRHLLKD